MDPKHSKRLIGLINGGSRYSAGVVSIAEDAISISVRETCQAPGQVGQLSFPPKALKRVRSPVGDRLLRHERADEESDEEAGYSIGDEGETESGGRERTGHD